MYSIHIITIYKFYYIYTIRRSKTNILCLAFNHAKESFFKKNAVRLLNETVSKI